MLAIWELYVPDGTSLRGSFWLWPFFNYTYSMNTTNFDDLLAFASSLAAEAGETMRLYFHNKEQHIETKDNNTLLTTAWRAWRGSVGKNRQAAALGL
jgi:hypothetical protein